MKRNDFLLKKQHKQWCAVLVFFMAAVVLCGCKNAQANEITSINDIQTTFGDFENQSIVGIKTVEPISDGWTHEQISNAIYLCGKPFSLPCKLEELPDDFETDTPRYRDKDTVLKMYITINGQDIGYYDIQLKINNENVGCVYYFENEEKENIVFAAEFYPNQFSENGFLVNGISPNSSFEDVRQSLGTSYIQNSFVTAIYDYKISNPEYPDEVIRIISFDENELIAICYSLIEQKKYS